MLIRCIDYITDQICVPSTRDLQRIEYVRKVKVCDQNHRIYGSVPEMCLHGSIENGACSMAAACMFVCTNSHSFSDIPSKHKAKIFDLLFHRLICPWLMH